MADDEQFSLCWNNFNSNLSAGFHESLCRGDLVDVTLAAEGQLVKAHRLVLSVCSPYFRKMFTQMPPNQHAFVFLKDVSHTALKDLIQFMYCGEVNVKQEALPAFISTAEALQIKGLTDSDPPTSQSPAKPSTPAPQPSPIQQMPSPRVRHRASTSRSYNIESMDESVDDKQTTQIVIQTTTPQKAQTTTIVQQPQHQQTQQQQQQHHHQTQQHYQPQQTTTTIATTTNVSHKRPAQRNSGVTSQTKRTKSTIDPLEATDNPPSSQQITLQTVVTDSKPAQQQANEAEFIDLPIELPTKSEPDYTEEAGEDVTAEQETTYVEDDSYGDMRYDESYFTENEDAANATANSVSGNISGAGASTSKAIAKQQAFSDSSYAEAADQTNNEAQESLVTPIVKAVRRRGRPKLKPDDAVPQEKLADKIKAAVSKGPGQPTIYASTTKGGMKLIYNGHHFIYSFRKGQYSIFQCCYKENKEQCKVRVVSDQKRVFHLDGEHVHFIQATDKSVTSLHFETAESQEESTTMKEKETPLINESNEIISSDKEIDQPMAVNDSTNYIEGKLFDEDLDTSYDADSQQELDANNFREKIKKRLQKALLGKKK